MPTLTYEIPRYAWVRLEDIARACGVRDVRSLVLRDLKATYPFLDEPPPVPEPEPQAAA